MLRARFFLLVALLLMAHPVRSQKPGRKSTARPPRSEKWVRQTLKKMSLEEKLGQLIFVFYYGGFLSTQSPQYRELVREVEENHVGGLVVQTQTTPLGIQRSRVYPAAALANELQRRAKIPLLIGADFERGTAMRLEEGTSFPHAMAIAAAGRPEDAYQMGKITALEARAAGVDWIFAPDADVNSNPANPIINTRSFGEDPARVAQFVAEYVRGVEENGALATAKHFPGHGDTSTDSHLDLPTVSSDRGHLENIELAPFRAAIAAGVSAIMTGHLEVPALDASPERPATLSPKITTQLLRGELGFDGLIVTDALDMNGITTNFSPGEVAVRSILAGSDVLLVPPAPDAALRSLKDAVSSGRIPMARIDDAVTRVLRAKAKVGLEKRRFVDLDALNTSFARPEFARTAQDIADRGVTLLRDTPHQLPIDATRPLRALLVVVSGDPDPFPGLYFERDLRWRVDSLKVVRTDTQFVLPETVKLPPPESYDLAIAAIFVRVADRKGTVGLPENEAALVDRLLAAGKPAVVACFGSPYLVERFPNAQTWLAAFSTVDVAQRAAARALFGQISIGGRLPVSIPGNTDEALKIGFGLDVAVNPMKLRDAGPEADARLRPVYELLDRAVADHAFPGGVLAVGHAGDVSIHAFGRQTYATDSPAVTPDTLYDAASLTKPVVTATLAAMLVEAGRLRWDAPVGMYLPEWLSGPQPDWRKKVTLRHLLTHTSGLPAHKDYFLNAKSKRDVLAQIFAEPLVSEPGAKVEYSDLGIILLGEILERVTGAPLDAFARERIFAPLGMAHSLFSPPKSMRAGIAPTENDTVFRKRQIRGEVHDENAWAMGGVAGHAGLFTTASDLAVFCQMMLDGGIYAHQRLLRRSTIAQMVAPDPLAEGTRTLGWTVPTEGSSSGEFFSAHSYGHTGFTGTSIWIDPDKNLFVVLLTNRVYPTRSNDKIREVRPALHDAVVKALGLAPATPDPSKNR